MQSWSSTRVKTVPKGCPQSQPAVPQIVDIRRVVMTHRACQTRDTHSGAYPIGCLSLACLLQVRDQQRCGVPGEPGLVRVWVWAGVSPSSRTVLSVVGPSHLWDSAGCRRWHRGCSMHVFGRQGNKGMSESGRGRATTGTCRGRTWLRGV